MRAHLHVAAFAGALLLSSTAAALDLSYAWRKGDVQRYRYEESTHFKALPGRAPEDEIVTVRSTFAERVRAVRARGAADVEVTLEHLEIEVGSRRVETLDQVPPNARTVRATMDRRGRVTLPRTLTVHVDHGQVRVAAGEGNPTDDAPEIDVIPIRLLELLLLPRGEISKGHPALTGGALRWSLARLDGSVAILRVTNLPGRPDSAASRGLAAGTIADMTTWFDARAGRLLAARGTLIRRTSLKVSSRVSLERL